MPLHSFLVHFPIACWLLGAAVLWVALWARRASWWQMGWFLLGFAAVFAIGAVVSGQQAYNGMLTGADVLEQHRSLGNLAPWPMGLLVLLYLHGTYGRRARALPRWLLCCAVTLTALLILQVGHLGGRVVHERPTKAAEPLIEKNKIFLLLP